MTVDLDSWQWQLTLTTAIDNWHWQLPLTVDIDSQHWQLSLTVGILTPVMTDMTVVNFFNTISCFFKSYFMITCGGRMAHVPFMTPPPPYPPPTLGWTLDLPVAMTHFEIQRRIFDVDDIDEMRPWFHPPTLSTHYSLSPPIPDRPSPLIGRLK